jgi:hypothetical protein
MNAKETVDIRAFLDANLFSGRKVNLGVMAVSGFSINVIDSFTLEEFTIGGDRYEVAVPKSALKQETMANPAGHGEERFPIHLHLDILAIASARVEVRPNGVNVPQSHKISFFNKGGDRLFWLYTSDPPQSAVLPDTVWFA